MTYYHHDTISFNEKEENTIQEMIKLLENIVQTTVDEELRNAAKDINETIDCFLTSFYEGSI